MSDKEWEDELERDFGPEALRVTKQFLKLDPDERHFVSEFEWALEEYAVDPKGGYVLKTLFESANGVRGLSLALGSYNADMVSQVTGTPTSELLDFEDAGRAVQLWFSKTREAGTRH
jgi:hypothetical protein